MAICDIDFAGTVSRSPGRCILTGTFHALGHQLGHRSASDARDAELVPRGPQIDAGHVLEVSVHEKDEVSHLPLMQMRL